MTRLSSALDLTRLIAQQHETAPLGKIKLIPIVVDDLATVMAFLSPLCDQAGGMLLDCREAHLNAAVPTSGNAVLQAAVEAQLRATNGSRRVALVDVGAGLVDAELHDPSSGPLPSPGERTVLALARALMHDAWTQHELIVIAYSATVLDVTFRQPAWTLATEHVANMPHPTVRTVVFVCESGLDVSLHGHVDTGFRFALDGDRLLKRTGRDNLASWAGKLAVDPEGIVLFLGAGFSASSRMPMGNGLRDNAIKRLLRIDDPGMSDSKELARRFRAWVHPMSGWLTPAEAAMTEDAFAEQLTLEQVVRAEQRHLGDLPTLALFREHHDRVVGTPGSAVTDLAAILPTAAGRRLVLVGVNIDLLVETHTTSGLRVFASDTDFEDAQDYLREYLAGRVSDVPYLKLHGSIQDPASCVVSAEQTSVGVGTGKLNAMRSLLLRDEMPRWWVYLGASMRDYDLNMVYGDADFGRGTNELWVAPWAVETVETYMDSRTAFWRGRSHQTGDDRLISVAADEFMAALRAAW